MGIEPVVSSEACQVHAIDLERVRRAARSMPPEAALHHLAETFAMMGDPTRLKILHALSTEELCVCDLAALLGLSVSAISHQLRLLRGMRLVKSRREGRLVYYSLDDHHIETLMAQGMEHVFDREAPAVAIAAAHDHER